MKKTTTGGRLLGRMMLLLCLIATGGLALDARAEISGINLGAPAVNEIVGDQLGIAAQVYRNGKDVTRLKSFQARVGDRVTELTYEENWLSWTGSISLTGLPIGEHTLRVTATDLFGDVKSVERTFIYDKPPVVTIESPLQNEALPDTFRLKATCTDDDPAGCAHMHVRVFSRLILMVPGSRIDQDISLSRYRYFAKDHPVIGIGIQGIDSRGRSHSMGRQIFPLGHLALTREMHLPGPVLDVDPDRVLYLKWGIPPHQLIVRDRRTLEETSVPVPSPDHRLQYGYLTPQGVVFVVYPPPDVENRLDSIYEWDGSRLELLEEQLFASQLTRYAVKRGDYLFWLRLARNTLPLHRGIDSVRRNLRTGETTVFEEAYGLSAAPNGDLAFRKGDRLHWHHEGVTLLLPEVSPDGAQLSYRHRTLTDGVHLVSEAHARSETGMKTGLWFQDPTAATVLLTEAHWSSNAQAALPFPNNRPLPEEQTSIANRKSVFQVRDGWTAYVAINPDQTKTLWLRSPQGETKAIQSDSPSILIDHLGPEGELTFTHGPNSAFNPMYLGNFSGYPPRMIGYSTADSFHLQGEWHLVIGDTLLRVPAAFGPGDVNGSGNVEIGDAVLTLQAAVEAVQLSPPQTAAADMDKNEIVDVSDAVKILRVIVGLDPTLPN